MSNSIGPGSTGNPLSAIEVTYEANVKVADYAAHIDQPNFGAGIEDGYLDQVRVKTDGSREVRFGMGDRDGTGYCGDSDADYTGWFPIYGNGNINRDGPLMGWVEDRKAGIDASVDLNSDGTTTVTSYIPKKHVDLSTDAL
jgi:hypothetical protein